MKPEELPIVYMRNPEIAASITRVTESIDSFIERANQDPAFAHPVFSKDPGYLVIRKNQHPWPYFFNGKFLWQLIYERDRGQLIGTSVQLELHCVPDVNIFIGFRPLRHPGFVETWKRENPRLDCNKPVFYCITEENSLYSNNYQEVLSAIFGELNQIPSFRTRSL